MTVLSPPHDATAQPPRRPRRRGRVALIVAIALVIALAAIGVTVVRYLHDDSRRQYLGAAGWPTHGQAAYTVGGGPSYLSPDQRPVPIASVAKVMTALLVLRAAPLPAGADGFRLVVRPDDVADTARRHRLDQSIVPVTAGETLTERDALAALLLPSANNVAAMLARRIGGTERGFVAQMNASARRLGMQHTRYTDPSGYLASTTSTAADQLRLASVAMQDATFARLVAMPSYRLPVGGTVHNTDTLLGRDGVVGIKTGSMDASGGCFMFRVRRFVNGRPVEVTGVVLGQQGHNLVDAGLYAGKQLADRVVAMQR